MKKRITKPKQSCPTCKKMAGEAHVCSAGVCSTCGEFFLLVAQHKCPVAASLTLDASLLFDKVRTKLPGKQCDACGQRHFVSSNTNPFRVWKSWSFCSDCYRIEEIQREIANTRDRLRRRDIDLGHVTCELCTKLIIDPTTQRDLCAYERDHVNVFHKKEAVGLMCQRGDLWADICREADQCRLLCKRCHSLVTYAERETGLLRLKGYSNVSASVIENVQRVTNELIVLLQTL